MTRVLALLLAGVLLLAGCASRAEFAPAAADRLQTEVLAVSTAAAGNRLPDALAQLDAVRVRADAARDADQLSEARYQRILAALAGVRADIEAAIAAQEAELLAQQTAERERLAEEERIRLEQEAAAAQAEAQRIADEAAAQAEAQRIADEAAAAAAAKQAAANSGSGDSGNGEKGKPGDKGKPKGKDNGDD